jgi:hypothetical protein
MRWVLVSHLLIATFPDSRKTCGALEQPTVDHSRFAEFSERGFVVVRSIHSGNLKGSSKLSQYWHSGSVVIECVLL